MAEEIVKQNNAIDIYEEYWADDNDVDAADLDTEAATMSTISQLRPPFAAGQHCAAHNASWHPDGSHKVVAQCLLQPKLRPNSGACPYSIYFIMIIGALSGVRWILFGICAHYSQPWLELVTEVLLHMQIAVALCTLTGEPQAVMDNPLGDHLSSYVWDLQDPNTPEHVFTPSSPILSLHFSPKDSKVMINPMWAAPERIAQNQSSPYEAEVVVFYLTLYAVGINLFLDYDVHMCKAVEEICCHILQILGAGHLNGQFAIYDTRRGVHAVDTTPVERCHR